MIVKRIKPSQDLKEELLKIKGSGIIVSGIGSLKRATLRLADEKIVKIEGPFEIISMQGTITADGIHVHMAIANKNGKIIGGHLKGGCMVHTTVEIAILPYNGILRRLKDEETGFMELDIGGP
ncbi:MAG: DNA-binding protein [Methanothermobacter sp.]|nr:DNA-binding protein [Methanothermobacter sp.]